MSITRPRQLWQRILQFFRFSINMAESQGIYGREFHSAFFFYNEILFIKTGNTNAGPTDPEVYTSSGRQPSTQEESLYDLPRPTSRAVPTTDDIREILEDLAAYELQQATRSSDHQGATQSGLPPFETARDASSTTTSDMARFPSPRYDDSIPSTTPSLNSNAANGPPGMQHRDSGISASIPQGSPPVTPFFSRRPPLYYRDYLHPDAAQAYHFICHSTWYIQVSATTIYCDDCATAEHVFCNRGVSPVWRHLHIVSRLFQNTSLHCGRCYKLLLHTRRAIDCLHCRQFIMDNVHRINHLTTQILCDATIFP